MRGALVAALAALVLWAYFEFWAALLPHGLYHFFVAPFVLGIASYWVLTRDATFVLWLIWLPFLAPLAPVIIIGGDPAKPGLEWLLYGPMVASLCVGELAGWLSRKIIQAVRRRHAEA